MGFFSKVAKTIGGIVNTAAPIANLLFPGAGSAISAITGAATGLSAMGAGAEQDSLNKSMLNQQWQMNKVNNQFNHDEAELQRNWQGQHDIDMFNLEAENKSYQNQVRQMQEAGLNPALMFGQGSLATPASASAGAGSAAGAAGAPTPPQLRNTFETQAGMMQTYADVIDKLSSAKNKDANTDRTIKLMDSEIEKMSAESAYTRVITDIENTLGRSKRSAEIQQLVADSMLKAKQGDLADAHKLLAQAETNLRNIQTKTMEDSLPYMLYNLAALGEVYDSQVKVNESQAALNDQQRKDLASTLQYRINNMRADTANKWAEAYNNGVIGDLNTIQYRISSVTEPDQLNAIKKEYVEKAAREGLLTDEVKEAVQRARKENSAYWWNFAFDKVVTTVSTAADAYAKIRGTGALLSPTSTTTYTDVYTPQDGWRPSTQSRVETKRNR